MKGNLEHVDIWVEALLSVVNNGFLLVFIHTKLNLSLTKVVKSYVDMFWKLFWEYD